MGQTGQRKFHVHKHTPGVFFLSPGVLFFNTVLHEAGCFDQPIFFCCLCNKETILKSGQKTPAPSTSSGSLSTPDDAVHSGQSSVCLPPPRATQATAGTSYAIGRRIDRNHQAAKQNP